MKQTVWLHNRYTNRASLPQNPQYIAAKGNTLPQTISTPQEGQAAESPPAGSIQQEQVSWSSILLHHKYALFSFCKLLQFRHDLFPLAKCFFPPCSQMNQIPRLPAPHPQPQKETHYPQKKRQPRIKQKITGRNDTSTADSTVSPITGKMMSSIPMSRKGSMK